MNTAINHRAVHATSAVLAALLVTACGGGSGGAGVDTQVPIPAVPQPTATWSTQTILDTGNGPAAYPAVAVGRSGAAVAVYLQEIDGAGVLYAAHGRLDTGIWGAPRQLNDKASMGYVGTGLVFAHDTASTAPRLAMDAASGDAVAVWSSSGGGIWAATYRYAMDTWSAPQRLDAGAAWATSAAVAMNAQGKAVAAWVENPSTASAGGAIAAYGDASGWRAPVRLSNRAVDGAPQVGIDALGDAVAAWAEVDPAGADRIMAARLDANGIAGAAARLDKTAVAGQLALALAPGGDALAAWVQGSGGKSVVLLSRMHNGAWSAPAATSGLPGESHSPTVALNERGAYVAWTQDGATDDSAHFDLYAATVGADGTPTAPVKMPGVTGTLPVIGLRDDGGAMLAWHQPDGTSFAGYSAATGAWSPASVFTGTSCAGTHSLAMDGATGKAAAVWIGACGVGPHDVYGAFYR